MTPAADFLSYSHGTSAPTLVADASRVLLVAPEETRSRLRGLLAPRLPAWDVMEADDVYRARFVLQFDPCDVMLLDTDAADAESALDWLSEYDVLPTLLLADDTAADFLRAALEQDGITHWLPRSLALSHPALLATVLRRMTREAEARRRLCEVEEILADSRRQVSRLVNRLWESVPTETGTSWYTQRHMLQRLQEEVERVKRHGGGLTVVLGELLPDSDADAKKADDLALWASEQVTRWKRRCDVAGQYGPHGFMLVLPRTQEPGALGCCQRLRKLLEQPASPLRGPLRACFGVATVSLNEGVTITRLLSQAEERLEQAKTRREAQ